MTKIRAEKKSLVCFGLALILNGRYLFIGRRSRYDLVAVKARLGGCPDKEEVMEHKFRNPLPTVDIIIEIKGKGIVLIQRKNPPYGWAIPGGFVDYGESLEEAAVREAREETGLNVQLVRQFHTYSDPARDPRFCTISTVYLAKAQGVPVGRDDAREARIFSRDRIPSEMAFDHANILDDYFKKRY